MTLDDNKPDYFLADGNETDIPRSETATIGQSRNEAPIRHRHRGRKFLILFIIVTVVALGATVYLRYFSPYVIDANAKGYVTSVEKRGMIFKTAEGEMITEQSLTDTVRVYSRNFTFSIANDSIADLLRQRQGTGRPVTVTYEKYYGVLPWRGASNCVVTRVALD